MNFKAVLFGVLLAAMTTAAIADECALKQLASLDVSIDANGISIPAALEGTNGYFYVNPDYSTSELAQVAVDGLKLRQLPVDRRRGFTLAYGHEILKYVDASIRLGGRFEFKYPVQVTSPPWQTDPKYLGLIGRDILAAFEIEFDLAHGKMNLFASNHCPRQVIYWTKSAPVAVVPLGAVHSPGEPRGIGLFQFPMQLDGKDVIGEMTFVPKDEVSSLTAAKLFGADANGPSLAFKQLSIGDIALLNPHFDVERIDPKTGCKVGDFEEYNAQAPSSVQVTSCSGGSDVRLGIPALKKLRIFLSFKEKTLYVTAADAN